MEQAYSDEPNFQQFDALNSQLDHSVKTQHPNLTNKDWRKSNLNMKEVMDGRPKTNNAYRPYCNSTLDISSVASAMKSLHRDKLKG